jgi:Amidohydrolase
MKNNNFKSDSRRDFFSKSGILLAFGLAPIGLVSSAKISVKEQDLIDQKSSELDLSELPNFCSHEHWGSINSIGFEPSLGFRCDTTSGATPKEETSIWDIILDPYQSGGLSGSGRDPLSSASEAGFPSQKEWWKADPSKALNGFEKVIKSSIMTGTFQCTCRGFKILYGIDLQRFKLDEWEKADKMIGKNYEDIFSWYQQAMKKAHFTELIRPVHPEFYFQKEASASKQQELSFTHAILRIDPFLDFWSQKNSRRDSLAKIAGVDPVDANSWKAFLKFYFDLAEQNHSTGIKQLQAYYRKLEYISRDESEVKFRGNLSKDEVIVFQDWIMHECCRLANQKKWVHQIHVGTHNLQESNPLPLISLGEKYPNMKIVMLHCWPFLKEAAFLAKNKPNFYIDTCWLPVLSPDFFTEALDTYLNYVPYHKIMLDHDSTSVEMAVGSSLFTREILTEKLLKQQKKLQLNTEELRTIALDLLHNNSVRLYGIGQEIKLN